MTQGSSRRRGTVGPGQQAAQAACRLTSGLLVTDLGSGSPPASTDDGAAAARSRLLEIRRAGRWC
jgi:hypothetical protein